MEFVKQPRPCEPALASPLDHPGSEKRLSIMKYAPASRFAVDSGFSLLYKLAG
jgi:hypothetical protein